jgi:hypothetical protein
MTISNEQQAIRNWLSKPAPTQEPCGCMGSARGEPVCRCAMAYVEVVNAAYYQVTEHRSPDGISHSAQFLCNVV